MPLYEYKCSKCNEVFEVLQRFSDAPLKVHDGCGGKVKRLLTTPNFQFKGSGFYITDYAHKHTSGAASDPNMPDNHSNGTAKSSEPAPAVTAAASKPAPAPSTTPAK